MLRAPLGRPAGRPSEIAPTGRPAGPRARRWPASPPLYRYCHAPPRRRRRGRRLRALLLLVGRPSHVIAQRRLARDCQYSHCQFQFRVRVVRGEKSVAADTRQVRVAVCPVEVSTKKRTSPNLSHSELRQLRPDKTQKCSVLCRRRRRRRPGRRRWRSI